MTLILAGTRLTASLLNSIAPQSAYKSADQSVTTNTTLQNDNQLFLPVIANGVYLIQCQIKYDASSGADIKTGWTAPSGATFDWNDNARLTTSSVLSSPFAALSLSSTSFGPGQGSGSNQMVYYRGLLINGVNAGNLQFQFAQNTSSGTSTRARLGSYLAGWRLA